MSNMNGIIAVASSSFYILAVAGIVPGILSQKGIPKKVVLVLTGTALSLHSWLLGDSILYATDGQNFSILNVASLVSLITSLSVTLMTTRVKLWFLLPIVYSFAAFNLVMSTFLPVTFTTHLENKPELLVHISFALSSYSTLMVGALYAIQLTWLDYKLKNKKALAAINPNIPPLMRVERQLFKIIPFGNFLLTVTLVTGLAYNEEITLGQDIHKSVLSFISWLLYSVLIWGHYRNGWRGSCANWLTIFGALILTLAYFGSRLFKEFFVGYL